MGIVVLAAPSIPSSLFVPTVAVTLVGFSVSPADVVFGCALLVAVDEGLSQKGKIPTWRVMLWILTALSVVSFVRGVASFGVEQAAKDLSGHL